MNLNGLDPILYVPKIQFIQTSDSPELTMQSVGLDHQSTLHVIKSEETTQAKLGQCMIN